MQRYELRPGAVTLTSLPAELIEKIYIQSENLDLPLTDGFLHRLLKPEIVKLHFCAHVFSHRFTSKHEYIDCNFAADNPRDCEIVLLQNRIVNMPWFKASFARRLEALIPQLRARAQHRRDEDRVLRGDLKPADYPYEGQGIVKRTKQDGCVASEDLKNVNMPQTLLLGSWTDEKVDLFHRLRGWYIDPILFPPALGKIGIYQQAMQQATQDHRQDVVTELDWYMKTECAQIL